jgi:hypothetical protein
MSISKLTLRPVENRDSAMLDAAREAYLDADIEVLHGYRRIPGIETALCEKGPEFIAAMVATQVVLFDFIQNQEAFNIDRFAAAIMLERALSFAAQKAGCVDAYVAVPSHLKEYIAQLERCGYGLAATNCAILRRPLTPDICPSLGDARDAEAVGPTPHSPGKFIPPVYGGFPLGTSSAPPNGN